MKNTLLLFNDGTKVLPYEIYKGAEKEIQIKLGKDTDIILSRAKAKILLEQLSAELGENAIQIDLVDLGKEIIESLVKSNNVELLMEWLNAQIEVLNNHPGWALRDDDDPEFYLNKISYRKDADLLIAELKGGVPWKK